jgi:hypothetical protein
MTGIIIGAIVAGLWSLIWWRNYNHYGVRYNPDRLFRFNYLLVGLVQSVVFGVVICGIFDLVIFLFHH